MTAQPEFHAIPGKPHVHTNPARPGETVTVRWAPAPGCSRYRLDRDGEAVWIGSGDACEIVAVPGVYSARAWCGGEFGPPGPAQEIWVLWPELCRITDREWKRITKRLVGHARSVAHRLRRCWSAPTGMPEAMTIEDLVADVIAGLYSAPPKTKWNPARGPLEPFLRTAVAGDIRNLAGSADIVKRARDPEGLLLESLPNSGLNPEDHYVAREREGLMADLLARIRNEVEKKKLHLGVLENILEGTKRRHTAKSLSMSAEEVSTARRALMRLIEDKFGAEIRSLLELVEGGEG